jgi:hypothetical protein
MGGMGGMGRGGMGRGGMGGRGGRGNAGGAARSADPMINSVDLILKYGTELALTDSQVTRLTAVKAHQDSAIATLKARLDSLGGRRDAGQSGAASNDGQSGDPMAAGDRMQQRGETMMAYRDALKQGRDAAFAVLEKKQRKQAEKYENALKKEMQDSAPADSRNWGGRRGSGAEPV